MKKISIFTLTLTAALVLTACGGGDSGTDTAAPAASPVTTAANANLAALSATTISSDGATEAFDVLVSLGDTWRLVVNKSTGAYTLTPIDSLYGLAAESGTLARTVSGDFVAYVLANKLSLAQDSRTGALAGSMVVGGLSAQVTGTPYQVADAAKLAGTYNVMGAVRNKVGGGDREFIAGQIQIASNRASATFCVGGLVDAAGNCTDVDSTDGKLPEKAVIALTKVTGSGGNNGGFYKMRITGSDNQSHDFGNLLVQNGNLGTVLLIDRYGQNQSGMGNTLRVGNFFAVKAQTLAGTEIDGSWACQVTSGTANLSIKGTANAVVNSAETPGTWTETLAYNRVNAASGALLAAPGFVVSTYQGEGVLALPLSASLLVFEADSVRGIAVCAKKKSALLLA